MKFPAILRALVLISLFALPVMVRAADTARISDAWARATPGQAANCAVYLTIQTTQDDTVLAASTPIAASASLHLHQMVDGVARMMPVARVDVAGGTPFRFAPMGYHIMLTGLKTPLKAGDAFPITLQFAKAGMVTQMVAVKPLREHKPATPMSAMPGMGSMPGMAGMDMSK